MNGLFQAGLEIQHFMENKDWKFCFIGGLAVIRWGESRMTQDIDLSLFTGFGNERIYIQDILKIFKSRTYDPIDFALKNRVLLVIASNDVAVDITFAGLPFESEMIERATIYDFDENCSLLTCSAEDLIVLKAFANRTRDWNDVEGIVVKNRESLDADYIVRQLTPLCELKGAPEIIRKLEKLFK